ncbi:MAG: hypothetical protein JSU87_05600 [Gemmatimonadota bacterium]|nr:MAG: hypothetical protein JSU87_05600 [Gemmatimonadota bacterium]
MDGVVRLQDWRSGSAGSGAESPGLGLHPRVPRRRHIFRSSEWTRIDGNQVRGKVTVVSAVGESSGEAQGPDVPGVRAEIAAQATLQALARAEGGEVSLALKSARVLRFMDNPIVVVGIYGVNGGEMFPLLGACLVLSSVEHASILATLQAVDRWLAWRARRSVLKDPGR